jgi:hypothetical protein
MAQYSSLLGTGIEVLYRFCCIDLRASGRLLSDSGTFVIIEQHLDHGGSVRVYQLKLPYNCIIKIEQGCNAAEPTCERRTM